MNQFDATARPRPSAAVQYMEGPPGPAGPAGNPGVVSAMFAMPTAQIGASPSYRIRNAATLVRATLSVIDAPHGSALVVEVLADDEVVTTLTVADGSTAEHSETLDVAATADTRLSVNATSIGTTTPAAGVVVQVDMEAS